MADRSIQHVLGALVSGKVDFILVGGVAAAMQGSSALTFDIDIVHSRTPENIERLLAVLKNLDARYRVRPELRPSESQLSSLGHSRLLTSSGPLDVLGSIEGDRDYGALLPESEEVSLHGHTIRILKLEFMLELKEASAEPKDRNAAMHLRAAFEQKRRLAETKSNAE